jgi:hypothetical protein
VIRPDGFYGADRELHEHAVRGDVLDLRRRPDDERHVRAEVIYWLCVADAGLHPRGVRLTGALIERPLDFEASALRVPLMLTRCTIGNRDHPDVVAVNLKQASCPSLSIDRCRVRGQVDAAQVRVDFTMSFHSAIIMGPVDISGAGIKGDLVMNRARLCGKDALGRALVANGVNVGGSLFFRSVKAEGAIRILGADIKGNLDAESAHIRGTETRTPHNALSADTTTVGGSMFLRNGFSANGPVCLAGVRVGDRLDLKGAEPFPRLVLQDARCSEFADSELAWPEEGELRLWGFQFGRLDDSVASPEVMVRTQGSHIDGAEKPSSSTESQLRRADYQSGLSDSRLNWEKRHCWLKRQGTGPNWCHDPYEQLAAYYSRTGDEVAAREIRIAKNEDELTHLKEAGKSGMGMYRFWRRPFGWLLGFGYRRTKAGVLLVALIVVGALAFWWFHEVGAMVPNVSAEVADTPEECGNAYECFNAPIYSADVVLPIIDFGQDSAWRPNPKADWGQLSEVLRWGLIAAGWLLATIFVAAFTGLVRRD